MSARKRLTGGGRDRSRALALFVMSWSFRPYVEVPLEGLPRLLSLLGSVGMDRRTYPVLLDDPQDPVLVYGVELGVVAHDAVDVVRPPGPRPPDGSIEGHLAGVAYGRHASLSLWRIGKESQPGLRSRRAWDKRRTDECFEGTAGTRDLFVLVRVWPRKQVWFHISGAVRIVLCRIIFQSVRSNPSLLAAVYPPCDAGRQSPATRDPTWWFRLCGPLYRCRTKPAGCWHGRRCQPASPPSHCSGRIVQEDLVLDDVRRVGGSELHPNLCKSSDALRRACLLRLGLARGVYAGESSKVRGHCAVVSM